MVEQDNFFGPARLGSGLDDTRADPTQVDRAVACAALTAILALAQASRDTAPCDRRTHRHHQVVFPQMANWPPADEADALRRRFSLELARIAPLRDQTVRVGHMG